MDRAAVMLDALSFSRGLSCPTFSDAQALEIATRVDTDQLSYNGFKDAYRASCDYGTSLEAANARGKGEVFADLIAFSRGLSCPTLSALQALQLSNDAASGAMSVDAFKTAYHTSCNYDAARAMGTNPEAAGIFSDAIQFSAAQSCPTLSTSQAMEVAHSAVTHAIDYPSFKQLYQTTCNYGDSLSSAASPALANAVTELVSFSRSISCPTLSDGQAIQVATLIVQGKNAMDDFKAVYQSTCDFNASLAASHCLRQ
jgi:hypothetical protein